MKAKLKNLLIFSIYSFICWELICFFTLVLPELREPFSYTGNILALIVLAPLLAIITTIMYAIFEEIKTYGT